jgi:F0F1-type ATP synthase delta subunit
MISEVKRLVNELISRISKRSDLNQIVFDIEYLKDRISYKSVASETPDAKHLKSLATKEVNRITSKDLKSFLQSMLEENNLWLFDPAHLSAFAKEFIAESKSIDFVEITCAIELKPEDIYAISENISKNIGKRVIVDIKINKDIIGGAIIKKDHYIIDYSIATKLNNLSSRWKESLSKSPAK